MRTSHNTPKNEQDFEIFCLKLLRTHWKRPHLELYAYRGQEQHGVDIIDLSGEDPLHAAQCKRHEEEKELSAAEVRAEVRKATTFTPPIGVYAILTTGKVKKA